MGPAGPGDMVQGIPAPLDQAIQNKCPRALTWTNLETQASATVLFPR